MIKIRLENFPRIPAPSFLDEMDILEAAVASFKIPDSEEPSSERLIGVLGRKSDYSFFYCESMTGRKKPRGATVFSANVGDLASYIC